MLPTLTRMGQGKRPDVDSLAALATWSRLNVDDFIIGKRTNKSAAEITQPDNSPAEG